MTENATLINPVLGLFEVLGLLTLRLPCPGWWWQGEDINDQSAQGVVFRTWGEGEPVGLNIAEILVADVTNDFTEPDMAVLTQADIETLDDQLRKALSDQLEKDGMHITKWMASQLNEVGDRKALVTCYIALDQGKERQFIAARFPLNGHKIIVIGSFEVALHQTLAKPVFESIQSIKFRLE